MSATEQETGRNPGIRDLILRTRQIDVAACYQCMKCSAGCPVMPFMDLQPHRVLRMLQWGMVNDVLNSETIWLCASCETCTTRCPNDIDIAALMDTLRQLSLDEGLQPAVPEVPMFHRAFLNTIRRTGRIHEVEMILRYKMASRRFADDMKLGMEMFRKGKIKLLPERWRSMKDVRRMFYAGRKR